MREIWDEWEKLRWLRNSSRESQRWRHDQPAEDNWCVEVCEGLYSAMFMLDRIICPLRKSDRFL